MSVDPQELKQKIMEIYPELDKYGVETTVKFEDETGSWIVTVKKGDNQLATHIEQEDAEKCLKGIECVHLGAQIGRFVEYYCMGGDACET
jgi:hypothetical protein